MKPLLLYDGDCFFCRHQVVRWRFKTAGAVEYQPYQYAFKNRDERLQEIDEAEAADVIHLVDAKGTVYRGAQAVYKLSTFTTHGGFLFWCYKKLPGFAPISEWGYNLVATNRPFFSRLTRFFFGGNHTPSTYRFSAWLFLKLLAVVYGIAFVSYACQVEGLLGDQGILPVQKTLELVSTHYGAASFDVFPTLAWIFPSANGLLFMSFIGAALALLLFVGLLPTLSLFLMWLIYLSLVTVGREFLGYQWDILLLECGFLAIFLSPRLFRYKRLEMALPSLVFVLLLQWLLFRLMWQSGLVKIFSGDLSWQQLTALSVHYETQPLPTGLSWYMHQLPLWWQKLSTFWVLLLELVVPIFLLTPRRFKHLAAMLIISLQVLIALTGNYTYFNLLTIALCLLCFDDTLWKRWFPFIEDSQTLSRASRLSAGRWFGYAMALFLFLTSIYHLATTFGVSLDSLRPLAKFSAPYRLVNSYGLFAVMTTERPEIIIEGSHDGENWQAYEFKYKPGDVKRRPGFVAPYQPRLDWQMWFAALGTYQQNPWFIAFCQRLLQGSPAVDKLLANNPFADRPPKMLRATLYRYEFTNPTQRRESGAWWQRRELKPYCPTLSLQD